MNVVIRNAIAEDTESLKKLMTDYIVHFYKKPDPEKGEVAKLIQTLQDNPLLGIQFVAEANGVICGFATLYFTFSTLSLKRAAILNDLYVSPETRGHKVGEQLFQTCLSFIREQDMAYMSWETGKDNLIAQKLYEKMGGQLSEWLNYSIR